MSDNDTRHYDRHYGNNSDIEDGDGDEALRQLTSTLLFLFSHGNHIPDRLLERLRNSMKMTFYPSSNVTANHIADHVGAVYEIVHEIMDNDTFTNALEREDDCPS